MMRKDQTSESKAQLLTSIQTVTKTQNPEVGRAVATYVDDPSEETVALAIQTLHTMGPTVVSDNQQVLSRVSKDLRRLPSTREAAIKALTVVP